MSACIGDFKLKDLKKRSESRVDGDGDGERQIGGRKCKRKKGGEKEQAKVRGRVKNSKARVFGELIPRYRQCFD